MRNVGFLLIGFSLLTLALVNIIFKITEMLYMAVEVRGSVTPYFAYGLTIVVLIFGIALVYYDKGKHQV